MDFYWIGQAFLNALTVGRYGSSNRGETRPREIIRKRAVADLNPAAALLCPLPILALVATHARGPIDTTCTTCTISKKE